MNFYSKTLNKVNNQKVAVNDVEVNDSENDYKRELTPFPMFHGSGFSTGLVATLCFLTENGSPNKQPPNRN